MNNRRKKEEIKHTYNFFPFAVMFLLLLMLYEIRFRSWNEWDVDDVDVSSGIVIDAYGKDWPSINRRI